MKSFDFVQSQSNITANSGLAVVGKAIKSCTELEKELNERIPLRHGIRHSDVVVSYLGLLCLGKNDFEAIHSIDSELFFQTCFGLVAIPSEPTLRQRMNSHADSYSAIVEKANSDFLVNIRPDLQPLSSGHVPIDADATLFDNSGSKKEGVARAYCGGEGYFPMIGYLGSEGYCLEIELRKGQQHTQNGTPEFLRRILTKASKITPLPLLVRMDGGHDSIENIDVILSHSEVHPEQTVDFIIKWNPRHQDKREWLEYAENHGAWSNEREGKRSARFSVDEVRYWKGYEYQVRRVMVVKETTIDHYGQMLLEPEIAIDGWWTSLDAHEDEIIKLYAGRGLSEQYHSEIKTDLDLERLPSGKFQTNQLVMTCTSLAYNVLRWIGQNGLLGDCSPKRHPAKRRRIKTVIQELMYVAARVIETGRRLKLTFGCDCLNWRIINDLYLRI